MKADAAMALSQDSRVLYVQEDARINVPALRCPGPASMEKGDAEKAETVGSWGLDRIDQRGLPLNGSYTPPNTASDVDVYIIDTGIRPTHQEFGGRAVFGSAHWKLDALDDYVLSVARGPRACFVPPASAA
jgi:subtilisin family serine protease